MKLSRRLISEGQPAAVWLAIAVGLGICGGLLIVWQSRIISQVIQAVFLESQAADQVFPVLFACLLLVGVRAAFTWSSEVSAHHAALQIKLSLRRSLVTHLYQLGPSILLETDQDETRSGELVNTAMQGIESLEAYYSQYLPQLALSALVPLAYLFFIAPIDPLTGFIMLVTAPLLPLFMYLIGSAAKNQTRRQWLQLSRMSAYLLEVLQGLSTLKALGRSREQSDLIDQVSENHRLITMSVLRITFLSALALEMIATLSTAVVAVEIGLRLLYGRLPFDQAFFILLLAPEFYLPLRLLGLRFHAGMAGVEAAQRIFELLDTPAGLPPAQPSDQESSVPKILQSPPAIDFDQVSFDYQDGRIGLNNATFHIPAGQVTVLAGESGAGKSTGLSLLLGFLHPQSGTISVNGTPLEDISWQEWMQQLAWVPQHPYIFSDTLAANISLPRPGASPEEIQQAACLAHADEFIQAQPNAYATQAGERGIRLSAGQAQRVALARAFIKDTPLVLLDEPGAHLDPETDAHLQDSLNQLSQGRTVLVIAHKPPENLVADQVVWLDEGRVVRIEKHSKPAKEPVEPLEIALDRASPEVLAPLPQSADSYFPESRSLKLLTLQRLLHLLTPYRWRVALSILLGSLTVGSSMGLMSTAAYLISSAALQPSIAELQVAIVGVRFFGLSRGVFRYLERLVTHDVTFRILGSLRGWFFRAVEPLVPARTQDRHSGDLLQRAIGDITALEDFYVRSVAPPLVAAFIGLTACLFLARFDLGLAVFLLIMFLLGGAILPALIVKLAQKPGRELIQQRARLSKALVDGISGLPDLLAYGQAERQIEKVVGCTRDLGRIQARLAAINGFQVSVSRLLADLAMLGVLWLGIQLVNQNRLDGVLLGALMLLAFGSFEAFFPLPQAALQLSSSQAAADRLYELADTTPEIKEPVIPAPIPEVFNLEVKHLSFRYESSGLPALSQISFSLTPPHRLAIVGTSGAGKSTLLGLILRFWDYPQGDIDLNGQTLRFYLGDDLRKRMSVLPQNTMLFSGTLYDNIRLKSPHASQSEIEIAAQKACIHDWIQRLPNGYQTWVGESGMKLSAGQRQRIALARTLLPVSPLLLLDEPTAHLDPKTEQTVMHGILETAQMHHASLLMVTHRLVCMEAMDEIVVTQNGMIVARGKHTELAAADGLYRRLWLLQH